MEKAGETVKKIIELMGFSDFSVSFDETGKRASVVINDQEIDGRLPDLVSALDVVMRQIFRRNDWEPFYVDVNYYRRERERIISELARAAARKVLIIKTEVALPPMNAYERRLVHLELSSRPDVRTDSVGEGRGRYVVVKPI